MKSQNSHDTQALHQALSDAPNLERFLSQHAQDMVSTALSEQISQMLDASGLRKADVARQAGISEVYLHQILSGLRTPSRNRLICLCMALGAGLEQTQALLKASGLAPLYPRNRRDAIILYGLSHGMDLEQINNSLRQSQERPLC